MGRRIPGIAFDATSAHAASPSPRLATSLTAWALRHPDLIADMDRRVAVMVEPTKRAIRRAMRNGRLGLIDTHLTAPRRPRSAAQDWPTEIREAARAARICGRWFNGVQTHLAFEALGMGS